VHNKRIINEKT